MNYNYAPIVANNNKAPQQEEKEVIQGGDYVTKILNIPVDINCLYEYGILTKEGKKLQKYIGFKRINDNEFSF